MSSDEPVKVKRVYFGELTQLLTKIFVKAGVSEENALILGENCAACERDGSHSHGLFRIPGYIATLRSGWVDGHARPEVEQLSDSFLRIDARNGFAQPALAASAPLAREMVSKVGVGVIAIRDCHHFSALWPDIEPFARDGIVALTTVTGLLAVVPSGGHRRIFGTNPIAFATPVLGSDPFIFDQATSTMSNGDLRLAALAGENVPLGTGVDRNGTATTIPQEILSGGGLLSFGGHKGASLSLMIEIMSSALTGGNFSSEVDFSHHPGAETPKTGQFILLIDPTKGGNAGFSERVRWLIDSVKEAGQQRMPSERRYANRAKAMKYGIPIPLDAYDNLLTLC